MPETPFPFTRRGFVRSVAGGVPAVLANQTAAGRQAGEAPWNGPAIVRKVYLANRRPGWPYPAVNIDQEVKELDANISQVERRYPHRIHFVGGEVLYSADEVTAWASSVGDADAILAVIVTSQMSPQLEGVIAVGKPTLVFEPPYHGHEWSHASRALQLGKKVDVVASSDYGELDPYADAFFTIHHLRHSKVLVVLPDGRGGRESAQSYTKQFGTEFVYRSYADIRKFHDVTAEEGTKLADQYIQGAAEVREPPRQETVNAMRVHLAILELLRSEKANAITMDCIGAGARKDLAAYPCVSFSKLNDQGLYGVCEADLECTMTHLLVTSFSGKPGFVSDPIFDTAHNEVIHAHCTSATSMHGIGQPGFPYILRGYPYSGERHATAVQVLFDGQGPVTVAKFSGPQNLLVSTGEVLGNIDFNQGCRSKMRTRVSDAHKFLRNYSMMNASTDQRPMTALMNPRGVSTEMLHRVVFYGDHVEMIERLGRLTGFKVIREI